MCNIVKWLSSSLCSAECSYCSCNLVSHFLCALDIARRSRRSCKNLLKFIAFPSFKKSTLLEREGKLRSPTIHFWPNEGTPSQPTDGRKYFPIMDNIFFLFISMPRASLLPVGRLCFYIAHFLCTFRKSKFTIAMTALECVSLVANSII